MNHVYDFGDIHELSIFSVTSESDDIRKLKTKKEWRNLIIQLMLMEIFKFLPSELLILCHQSHLEHEMFQMQMVSQLSSFGGGIT